MFGTAKPPLFSWFSGLKRYSNTFLIQSFSFFIFSETTKRVYYPMQYFQLTEIDCWMFVGSHYSLCPFRKANWWENQHFREHLILTRKKNEEKNCYSNPSTYVNIEKGFRCHFSPERIACNPLPTLRTALPNVLEIDSKNPRGPLAKMDGNSELETLGMRAGGNAIGA